MLPLQDFQQISIHAPHAGSDSGFFTGAGSANYFNPRSPCGERQQGPNALIKALKFQSTLPMRGATARRQYDTDKAMISIHAPHAGSDCNSRNIMED